MTTPDSPEVRADNARQVLRQLTDATRHIEDPTQIYPILSDLANALASFSQSLHQIAAAHEAPARHHALLAGDERAGRATSYQIAWELHRAAEMMAQATKRLDRAHDLEATITYDLLEPDLSIHSRPPQPGHGVSL